jgi:hypothetical protein
VLGLGARVRARARARASEHLPVGAAIDGLDRVGGLQGFHGAWLGQIFGRSEGDIWEI